MRRSKKGFRVLGAAASLCLVLTLAACGGSDEESEEDLVDQLSETLQSGSAGFDAEAADCFAEIVVDEVGVDELRDVDLGADEPPEELQDEIAAATVRAAEECDLGGGG
jgi:hypothetical protein